MTTTTADWRDAAACRKPGVDPDWFFTESGASRDAHRICAACPVADPCLTDALRRGPYLLGYWAGTTQEQRRNIIRGTDDPSEGQAPEGRENGTQDGGSDT